MGKTITIRDEIIIYGHICASDLTIAGSGDGLSPGRHQATIWTNYGIFLIGSLGTNFREILIEIHTFSFEKMHFELSSAKWHPFCLWFNVLRRDVWYVTYFIRIRSAHDIFFNMTYALHIKSEQSGWEQCH